MQEEIWKDIEGYEGLYQVSNYGRIKRILFRNGKYTFKKEKILVNVKAKDYYRVTLSKNNIKKIAIIHKLVANAFIPKIKGKNYVNHKDGNKLNNRIDNLEWCTLSENTKHAFSNGLMKNYKLKYEKMKKPVIQYNCITNEIINIYESIREAERQTGVYNRNIIASCKNKNRNAGGYKWEYLRKED